MSDKITCRLTRNEFGDIMKLLVKVDDMITEMDKLGLSNDDNILFKVQDGIVNLLDSLFGDECDMISWWCFENDFGKMIEEDSIINTTTSEKYDVRTADKLFDYMRDNYNLYS